ncbi:MAG: helix-turn-helix domain-containing protein [Myxococcota bacterium]
MVDQESYGGEAGPRHERRKGDRRASAGILAGAKGALGLPHGEDVLSSAEISSAIFDEEPMGDFEPGPIGGYLRKQRILREISISELSSMTRIPQRSLERLESGQFDGETDGFVRGFVRTVANALGLDEEDTLSRMLQEPSLGVWERHSTQRSLKQGLALVVIALVAVVGFVILRTGWNVLVGVTSDAGRGEVVLWQDPVRALAEATGAAVDPMAEIDPRGSGVRDARDAGSELGSR